MSERLAEKLLERHRVGALLRIFASRPEFVEEQIDSAIVALKKLIALRAGERKTFSRIDFLVSSDPQFDDSDCGLTASRLREVIALEFAEAPVHVYEIKKGDIYCMLLDYGVVTQLEDRIPYSLILSHRASSYITNENVNALLASMFSKARVAGLALHELGDTVLDGRIVNTFAIWHNKSLMTVGGFDLRAGKPPREIAHSIEMIAGHSLLHEERFGEGKVTYHAAGCEEIIPLLRFTRYFGKSIQAIPPESSDADIPSLMNDEWLKRHHAKLATKDARQRYMAELEGYSIDYLKEGVIPDMVNIIEQEKIIAGP